MACNCTDPCTSLPECTCPVKDLKTDCSVYNGPTLGCSGITSGTILTSVIQQLDEFICNKFNEVGSYFNLQNIGDGAKVYRGIAGNGSREIRSIKKGTSNLIIVQELEDTIELNIDEEALTTLITNSESTYSVENIDLGEGIGVGIYKDSTIVGNNTQFNLKKIVTDSLLLTEEADLIRIEAVDQDLGGVRDFIVNTLYEGDEELGTFAKPYKTLDAAIVDYIGSGTNHQPQFLNSRILCTGGESHEFTSSLSIRNLVLEVDTDTEIVYTGTDLYPIDFSTLQTALGGYSSQTNGITVTVQGEGKLTTEKLFANLVSSGDAVSSTSKRNTLILNGVELTSIYKLNEFLTGILRSDTSPWLSRNQPNYFYFGTINEPIINITATPSSTSKDDNSNNPICVIDTITLKSLTQKAIVLNGGEVQVTNSILTYEVNPIQGQVHIIADASNLEVDGVTILEDPLLSYDLPNFKPNLNIIETSGISSVIVNGKDFTRGANITEMESWIKLGSNTSTLNASDLNVKISETNALPSNWFIDAGGFNPTINISNCSIDKPLIQSDGLINSSLGTYEGARVENCNFRFNKADNIDLTKANTISVTNVFNSKIKESLQRYGTRNAAITVGFTEGDVFINTQTLTAGSFIAGEEYRIETIGTTDYTLIGATSNTVGLYFTATGPGVGTGTASHNYRDIIV